MLFSLFSSMEGNSAFRIFLLTTVTVNLINVCRSWEVQLAIADRNKRQLYHPTDFILGLDTKVEENGPWGPWTVRSTCSRTCGGGVSFQSRICLDYRVGGFHSCVGPSRKYFSCNIQDCPANARDFRTEQCARFNSIPFEGKYYSWIPFYGAPNPCELNCMPKGARYYHRRARRVIDGTLCHNDGTTDVCVNGICLPLPCDKMLGSDAKEDKCGVCGGDDSSCHIISGIFDREIFNTGYNDILLIPPFATSILIEEVIPNSNYFAVRNISGYYYLNGNWKIEYPGDFIIAGVEFHYERKHDLSQPERLWSAGPTLEPLFIVLLYQERNPGIRYEYSVPVEDKLVPTATYVWETEDFQECSKTCSGGEQHRLVYCKQSENNVKVEENLCDIGKKPPTTRECHTQPCPAMWHVGEWSQCSQSCAAGVQYRLIYCQQLINGGVLAVTNDGQCELDDSSKPPFYQICNQDVECPRWHVGPWSACNRICGPGNQTREVTCETGMQETIVLDDFHCDLTNMPPIEKTCSLRPCEGVEWIVTEWSGCSDKCGPQKESRELYCANSKGEVFSDELCHNKPIPELTRPCPEVKPCSALWHTSEWSRCSAKCGTGVQTRFVFCGIWKGDSVKKISDSNCKKTKKFTSVRNCTRTPCKGSWFSGPWSQCSVTCGGGTRTRKILCFHKDSVVTSSRCDPSLIPPNNETCSEQSCIDVVSTEPSVNCSDSEYGCCSDGKTVAGPNLDDCPAEPDCIDSYYGCCLDGLTAASGPFGAGCPDITTCNETKYGCCSDGHTIAKGPKFQGCPDVRECELTSYKCCPDNITIATGPNQEGCDNVTETCDTSDFGCCPDNVTFSMGPDHEGCENVTETCDTSEFGCCPDNVTFAMGPDHEGCDNVTKENVTETCETSEFGCCADNVTFAMGPDFEGCDNVTKENMTETCVNETFALGNESCEQTVLSDPVLSDDSNLNPCHYSEFGCCPDNKSEALGPDNVGCHCSTLEYGCCADNITPALGPNQSGCYCEISVYGCCQDDYTMASGPDFQGCNCEEMLYKCCPDGITPMISPWGEGCSCQESKYGCCPDGSTSAAGENYYGCPCDTLPFGCCQDKRTPAKGENYDGCPCNTTEFGCCPDGKTPATSNKYAGCPCISMKFGCCPDGVTAATGPNNAGCSCENTTYGCCPDKKTPAKGPNSAGCSCSTFPHGCCPDGKTSALGPNFMGCSCHTMKFGCCPDGFTPATGPNDEGCTCDSLPFKCCPDDKTPAKGLNFAGCHCSTFPYGCCPDNRTVSVGSDYAGCTCHSMQHGCCPDGVTIAEGPNYKGCPCSSFSYGCCPDDLAIAEGPNYEGCPCSTFPHGCCPDGTTAAIGPDFKGCPGADFPKPLAAEVCHLEHEIGPCQNYSVKWYFDVIYGGCSRFWYGGCEGNGNRFNTQEDCEKLCVSPKGKAACFLPKIDGSCDGKFPLWYYNSQTKQCEEFIYKGCLGNNNRFISKEICEETCTSQVVPVPVSLDICDLPKKEGTCTAAVIYWYFNTQTQTCEQFYYSGCDGNDNRFKILSDCENRCLAKKEKDTCKLPQVIGNCYDFKQRWFFDVKTKECKSFYYSGCNGNKNNFGSYHECEEHCGKSVTTVKPEEFKIEYCFLDQDSGSCPNREIRWYYDKTDGVCKEFYYGGCEGNGNRFQSRRECETKCTYSQDICKLPKVQGSCSGSFVQWYYSHSTDECNEFMFSGCQGNANRFDDKERCEKYCKITSTSQTQDICTLPRESGPCLGEYTQWYYDTSTNSCKKFKYGGCQGNNNRFQSRRDCELRCIKKLHKELHTTTYSTISHDNADICQMAVDTGLCNEFHARWFYDPSSKTCLPFVYTGCGGNKNRFKTFDICMKFCDETKENIPDATTKLPCPVSNCDQLQCPFGKEEKADEHGCIYCRCSNPCEVHTCPEDSRCAIEIHRTVEGEPHAQPICRLINKLGECPKIESKAVDTDDTECTERCRLDSDCRDDRKCCFNGCTNICMDPIFETTTILTSEINEINREDSSIQPTEFNETTIIGSTVSLICKVAKGSTFMWSRNNVPLQVDDTHITILSNGTLFIQRIEENDHGSYLCITRDNYGQSKVYTFHLHVQVPARILPGPTLVIVQISQPATLQCTATGFPNPMVTWWKDKILLPTKSARFQQFPDYSLLIRTVTYQDIGVYTCQAYNGLGALATLDISVRLSQGSETKSSSDFDNGNTLKETSTDRISPITEKETSPVDLSVEIKTINSKVKVGDLVQLDCIVKGTDSSTVTWYFNNNVIQIDDKLKLLPNNTLLISNIQNAHNGNYRCHAQYNNNHASASVAITVEDSSDGVPEGCVDDPRFNNCIFIVKARYCSNKHYEKYCCRSCYLAKEITVN